MFEILKKAARAAAKIQLDYFRQEELDVRQKTGHNDIVTVADKKSQDVIQQTIIDEMQQQGVIAKDIGFIGEEKLQSNGSHMFVIDPIDGTSNFATGMDYFCSSIGYFKNGVLTAGSIYRPTHDELYIAEKEKGAYLIRKGNKQELHVNNNDTKSVFLSTEAWNQIAGEEQMEIAGRMLSQFRAMRIYGAMALDLALVAENVNGVVLTSTGPWIWDIAAAHIILTEAGGAMYEWNGTPLIIDVANDQKKQFQFFACHPSRKEFVLTYIHES